MNKIEKERMAGLNRARFRGGSKSDLLKTGSRLAISAATGGVGRAVGKEVRRRVSGKVSASGEKMARRYQKKKGMTAHPQKKLSGMGFWMIFSLSLLNTFMDVFLNFTFILSAITLVTSLVITFIIGFYLYNQGVKPSSRKLALWITSIIIESIPFLNMLPAYPVSLLMMKKMENSDFLKKHAGLLGAKAGA